MTVRMYESKPGTFDKIMGLTVLDSRVKHKQTHTEAVENPFDRAYRKVPVNIFEYEDKYLLEAYLPGVSKDEISFSIHGEEVCLTYEPKEKDKANEEERKCVVSERWWSCGSGTVTTKVERMFVLPGIDIDGKTTAKLSDGILKVEIMKTMPKTVSIDVDIEVM